MTWRATVGARCVRACGADIRSRRDRPSGPALPRSPEGSKPANERCPTAAHWWAGSGGASPPAPMRFRSRSRRRRVGRVARPAPCPDGGRCPSARRFAIRLQNLANVFFLAAAVVHDRAPQPCGSRSDGPSTGLGFLPPRRLAFRIPAGMLAATYSPVWAEPPAANRTRSLPGLWHGDASGHHALVRETGSGQNAWVSFGKQGWVKFSRAPKPGSRSVPTSSTTKATLWTIARLGPRPANEPTYQDCCFTTSAGPRFGTCD